MGYDEEILPVVDENDNIIGKATWTECHDKGPVHRSAGALLFRDKTHKKILIQKRAGHLRHDAGRWENPGGHVHYGHTYEETVRKEIEEELFRGKEMPQLEFKRLFKIRINDLPNNHEFVEHYEVIHSGQVFPDQSEVSDAKFVDTKELLEDIKKNPSKYTNSFKLVMQETIKRDLLNGI